jgi:hypothetical protein
MAWNVLNPIGKAKPKEVDWRARYKTLLASFDYQEVKRLKEQNRALSSKVKELSHLLSVHRQQTNTTPLDLVDVMLADLHKVPLKTVYEKYGKGNNRTKHILRFIAYHGYDMSLKDVGWRYGKTGHSNITRAMNKVIAWYQTGQLTDAEISLIKEYTKENIFDGL